MQRIHANDAYTHTPYNAYLNDYYVLDGDGAVVGQTVQDDTFYYSPANRRHPCCRPARMGTPVCWTVWKAPIPGLLLHRIRCCLIPPTTVR